MFDDDFFLENAGGNIVQNKESGKLTFYKTIEINISNLTPRHLLRCNNLLYLCLKHDAVINKDFKSVVEIVKAFPDEQTCIDHLESLRWNGNIVSPFDAISKVYKCKGNKYKCKNTGKYFNVRTAILFDNTKIELQKWFMAIYLITGHKKGISSLQLSRELGVTQKTAWFMNNRIRECFGMTGEVENDEIRCIGCNS